MIIKKNAEQIANNYLKRDNIVSTKKVLEINIKNSYTHKFIQELQIYVTKIGLVLNDCLEDINIRAHTYLGSIELICKKVIKNDQLFNVMKVIDINTSGNTMKHEIEDIKIDIEYTLKQYNNMISELIKATKIQAYKQCFLNKKQNVRDVAFSTEKKHHKYFVIEDKLNNRKVKMQIKINPNYEYDLYSKTAKSKVTIFWPEGYEQYFINISVINTKNKRVMASKKEVHINNNEGKIAIWFTFNENDLDRRVIYFDVKIELLVNKVYNYTTGILFWKENHSYSTKESALIHIEHLSQLYAENNKK